TLLEAKAWESDAKKIIKQIMPQKLPKLSPSTFFDSYEKMTLLYYKAKLKL
ncbi:5671_t:CDS:2, partial [Gigaspora margarita]